MAKRQEDKKIELTTFNEDIGSDIIFLIICVVVVVFLFALPFLI